MEVILVQINPRLVRLQVVGVVPARVHTLRGGETVLIAGNEVTVSAVMRDLSQNRLAVKINGTLRLQGDQFEI